MQPLDLTGRVFGQLTARRPTARRTPQGRVVWLCECSCGAECEASSDSLAAGNTKSCGCRKAAASTSAAVRAARAAGADALGRHKVAAQGPRVCPRCRAGFAAVGRQVYCSPDCQRLGADADADAGADRCGHCGGPMDRRGYRRVYCGRRCKRLADRERSASRRNGGAG